MLYFGSSHLSIIDPTWYRLHMDRCLQLETSSMYASTPSTLQNESTDTLNVSWTQNIFRNSYIVPLWLTAQPGGLTPPHPSKRSPALRSGSPAAHHTHLFCTARGYEGLRKRLLHEYYLKYHSTLYVFFAELSSMADAASAFRCSCRRRCRMKSQAPRTHRDTLRIS